jgi:hypothetical protein
MDPSPLMLRAVAAIAGNGCPQYAQPARDAHDEPVGGAAASYGTKVAGGAVLSGGVVGLFIGALTWR